MKSKGFRAAAAAGAGVAMLSTALIGLTATSAAASTTGGKRPAVAASTPEASPRYSVGSCPATVTFTSRIKVKVKGTTKVAYRWLHGDGSKSKVKEVTLHGRGHKTLKVTESATFGKSVKGWQALQVLAPVKVTTRKGYFSVSCKKAEPVKRRVFAKASVDVDGYHGVCAPWRKVTAEGVIRVSRPTHVRYRWIHNGEVVDHGSTKVWDGKRVSYSFTPKHSHKGWVALEILHPRFSKGDRDFYRVECTRPAGHHKPNPSPNPKPNPHKPYPRPHNPVSDGTAEVVGVGASPDTSSCAGTKGPKVNFTGRIAVSGAARVAYRWTAGGVSKSGVLHVHNAGTYTVDFAVDGDPHGSATSGTVTLEVTSPNSSSASQSYSFTCPKV